MIATRHASRVKRLVGLVLITCLAIPFALDFHYVGAAPYGNGYPGGSAEPCVLPEALPPGVEIVAHEFSSEAAAVQFTSFPLGIVCAVQLANPARTEVFTHQSWPATIAWLTFTVTALLAIGLALLCGRRLYRQRSHSTTSP